MGKVNNNFIDNYTIDNKKRKKGLISLKIELIYHIIVLGNKYHLIKNDTFD